MTPHLGQDVHYVARRGGCQAAKVAKPIEGSPTGSAVLAIFDGEFHCTKWDTAMASPGLEPGTWHPAEGCGP